MNDAMEKPCVHYPLYYLLIMKYIYANLIFESGFIWFCWSYKQCPSRKRHAKSERYFLMTNSVKIFLMPVTM